MQCYKLLAADVPVLIKHLGRSSKVFAPHRKGDVSFTFKEVDDPHEVVLDYNRTLLPLKKFFLPPVEKLLDFSLEQPGFDPVEIDMEERVYFAVHSYEMQSVLRLDHNMLVRSPEANYFKRRQKTHFVGISYDPDEFHFGESVGIPVEATEGFDLFLNKIDENYQLIVVTEFGEEMLKGFKDLSECGGVESPERKFKKRLRYHYNRLPKVFDDAYNSEVWNKVADQCVGCGTCNLVCPTCYCFDVKDEVNISAKDGSRQRNWDGCMLMSFAEVAGGENFREKNSQRTRHRLYRKFKYITDQEGLPWCIGCGRCTAFCPAGISLTDIVNDLIQEHEDEQYARAGRVAV